jgi:hypothetical protein
MSAPDVEYRDHSSVLVVKGSGELCQLFVPFRVQCIHPLERIPEYTWVYVNGVFPHPKYRMIYWINQRLHPYHHFQIHPLF